MTYHDEWLKHHGVKGMKWGVKRYKSIRKEAKKQQVIMDVHAKRKAQADNAIGNSGKDLKKANNKLADARQKHDFYGTARTAKKVEKANNNYQSKLANHQSTQRKNQNKSKGYTEAKTKYDSLVREASELPVTVHRRDKLASLKKEGKKQGMVVFDQYLKSQGVELPKEVRKLKISETRNDRFASDVHSKQIESYKERIPKNKKKK